MQSSKERTKINGAIDTALKNLGAMVDVNTAIGKPIKDDEGNLIIPVSKVTFGVLSGGGEYGKINIFKKGSDLPYSAGNGAIVSMKPCGFLVKSNKLDYKLITFTEKGYDVLLDKFSDLITNVQTENNDGE